MDTDLPMPFASSRLPRIDSPYAPPPGVIPLGRAPQAGGGDWPVVGMHDGDLAAHLLITGRTGTGKSFLAGRIALAAAQAGDAVLMVEAMGYESHRIISLIAEHCPARLDDIVLVDFSDAEWTPAFNPLDIDCEELVDPVLRAVMSALCHQMARQGGVAPRSVNYLMHAVDAILRANVVRDAAARYTILDVPRFLTDRDFRVAVMAATSHRQFGSPFGAVDAPFELLPEQTQMDHVMPALRAFAPLGSSRFYAAALAMPENRLDVPALLDEGAIVLVRLAHQYRAEDVGRWVNTLLLSHIFADIDSWGIRRGTTPGDQMGMTTRVILDHAATSLAAGSPLVERLSLLSARDVGVIMTAAGLRQFDADVAPVIDAGVANQITLAVDPACDQGRARRIDAGAGAIDAVELWQLPDGDGYANVRIDRRQSGPFALRLERGRMGEPDVAEIEAYTAVAGRSRVRVGVPRDTVEAFRAASRAR